MKMLFNKIKDSDFDLIASIQKNTQYNGSEWSKLYLKSWDFFSYDQMEIAIENDVIYIRFPVNKTYVKAFEIYKHIYLPPVCKIEDVKVALDNIQNQTKLDDEKLAIIGIPQEYLDAYGEYKFNVENIDFQKEYLYSPQDLCEFKGKKYHQKRNHISAFDKSYSYTFRPYAKEDRCAVEKLLTKWETKQSEEYMVEDEESEHQAIEVSLDMAFDKNIYVYVLYVGDNLVGFTLGEITPSNVGIVHIEKADIEYTGSYTKLVNLFAKEVLKDARVVNRQEDMGDEGLRQSKESYRPIGFAMKFFITD